MGTLDHLTGQEGIGLLTSLIQSKDWTIPLPVSFASPFLKVHTNNGLNPAQRLTPPPAVPGSSIAKHREALYYLGSCLLAPLRQGFQALSTLLESVPPNSLR